MAILHRFSGAVVRRTIDPSHAVVAEHAHDWPMLSVYVMGGYRNVSACGEHDIDGPSFVFYGRGAAHRNDVGVAGFEQLEIEFDPDWLGASALPRQPVLMRIGGRGGARARQLAAACGGAIDEECLRRAVHALLAAEEDKNMPAWIGHIDAAVRKDPSRRIGELARRDRRQRRVDRSGVPPRHGSIDQGNGGAVACRTRRAAVARIRRRIGRHRGADGLL